MDSYLWITKKFMVPSYTIAFLSFAIIGLLQYIKKVQDYLPKNWIEYLKQQKKVNKN